MQIFSLDREQILEHRKLKLIEKLLNELWICTNSIESNAKNIECSKTQEVMDIHFDSLENINVESPVKNGSDHLILFQNKYDASMIVLILSILSNLCFNDQNSILIRIQASYIIGHILMMNLKQIHFDFILYVII